MTLVHILVLLAPAAVCTKAAVHRTQNRPVGRQRFAWCSGVVMHMNTFARGYEILSLGEDV